MINSNNLPTDAISPQNTSDQMAVSLLPDLGIVPNAEIIFHEENASYQEQPIDTKVWNFTISRSRKFPTARDQ